MLFKFKYKNKKKGIYFEKELKRNSNNRICSIFYVLWAGNLIFPPTLGYIWQGKVGLLTTFGFNNLYKSSYFRYYIYSHGRRNHRKNLQNKVGKILERYFTVIMLAIGPLFCIPRTGATTFWIRCFAYVS